MVTSVFLSPKKTVPDTVAEWISNNLSENPEKTFFGSTFVLVPTKSAAKTLAAKLAERAGEAAAIGGIEISTFEVFAAEMTKSLPVATAADTLGAWLDAIMRTPCPDVFRNGAPARENAMDAADEFIKLQNMLSENGMAFADVLEVVEKSDAPNQFEISLWSDLANLEAAFLQSLRAAGKLTIREALKMSAPARRFKKLVLAANPDIPQIALELAKKSAEEIFAIVPTNADNACFDALGRPIAEKYAAVPVNISENNTYIFASVEDEARAAANAVAKYPSTPDYAAVSCEQTANAKIFARELAARGIKSAPRDCSAPADSALLKLLKCAAEYGRNPDFENFSAALGNPLLLGAAARKFSATQTSIAEMLDTLREEHIPVSAADALKFADETQAEILLFAKQILEALFCSDANKTAAAVAELVSADTESAGADDAHREGMQALEAAAQELSDAAQRTSFLPREVCAFLTRAVERKTKSPEFDVQTLILENWLEIFWSDKPLVMLCDINDGTVPMAEPESQFLTDSLRAKLGLRNPDRRAARDAYMLQTLIETRGEAAQILLPRKDADDAPLTPSRILMKARNLPARVKFLFAEPKSDNIEPSAPTPVPLSTDARNPDFTMSASKFRTYLASPFSYYVQYVLGAREITPAKSELDELQYGSLLHWVMERFGKSEHRDSENPDEIHAYLNTALDAYMRKNFGEISAQVRIQILSMRQKFRALAEVQARHAAEGWRFFETPERFFEMQINGARTTGSIDRIDFNKNTGEFLVVDYKTYKKFEPSMARKSHYEKCDADGNPVWKDLQMPLYCAAAKNAVGQNCKCALLVLPLETSATGFDEWDITPAETASALDKAAEIVEKIRRGEFRPDPPPQYPPCKNTFRLSKTAIANMVQKR